MCVIPLLAKSEKLSAVDIKPQQEVSEFLASRLLTKGANATWWEALPRKTAGAAIERAGRDIDALKFYENWRDSTSSNHQRRYAENRWAICKLRQAKREEAEGNTKKASEYRHSAEQVMQKYRWDEQAVLDVFPEIDEGLRGVQEVATKPGGPESKVSTAAERRDKEAGQLGSIAYRFILAKNWVNLESQDGLCARVLLNEMSIISEDVSFCKDGESSYFCEEWDLRISWFSRFVVTLTHGGVESREINFGETHHEAS